MGAGTRGVIGEARSRKAEQSEATRDQLLEAARALFSERGYQASGTDQIAQRAGVSRGALYHQFRDKEALFRGVYEELQRDLIEAIRAAIAAVAEQSWEVRLRAGFAAYLDFFLDAGVRRIALQDAPAVLDWDARDEIHTRLGLGALMVGLRAAMDEGAIEPQPVLELAHVIHGALNEGAMAMARSADSDTRARVGAAIDRLLAGLTARGRAPAGGVATD